MNDVKPATSNWDTVIRWIARLSSLAINSVFLLILVLAVTNEDKPQGAAIRVLLLLVLTMVSCLAAWRWERAGGIAVLLSAVCLGVAVYAASRTYGVGPHFLAPLLYAVPYLLVGTLFLLAARGQRSFGRSVKTKT
jgi:asparagine N-glycosylation enzyme membrane subunit Stt3